LDAQQASATAAAAAAAAAAPPEVDEGRGRAYGRRRSRGTEKGVEPPAGDADIAMEL
jgi:hypothetical protein